MSRHLLANLLQTCRPARRPISPRMAQRPQLRLEMLEDRLGPVGKGE